MPETKHIPSLDGIRGLAVLLVVAFHFLPRTGLGAFGEIASFGWAGVDAFLVLSGFLITGILYRQRGRPRFFRNFYLRRALRLFPLYYFILCLAFLLTPFLHIHWKLGQIPFFFYAANMVLSYDQALGGLGPLNFRHFWTLALEEQFYLIWPWIIGSRISRAGLLKVCAAGIAVAVTVRLALAPFPWAHWFIYYSLPTRMDSLLIGAALALISLPTIRTAHLSLLFAGLVYLAVVWKAGSLWFLSRPMMSIGYTAQAVLFASLIVLALHPRTFSQRVFSSRPLRFYGKYSYGIYLWHSLLFDQFDRFSVRVAQCISIHFVASLTSFAAILLGSTLVAMASYHLLEEPFLTLKRHFEA